MICLRVFNRSELDNLKCTFIRNQTIDNAIDSIQDINDECIIYYAKRLEGNEYVFITKIKEIKMENKSCEISFYDLQQMKVKSEEVNNKLYGILRVNDVINSSTKYIPNIVVLDLDDSIELKNRINGVDNSKYVQVQSSIENLKLQNDWEGIVNLYGDLQSIKTDNELWNSVNILSELGFAASKLAACGALPREFKNDISSKNKYLNEKRMYRDFTEVIYKRCIELQPKSSKYYSALAYLYYTNIQDLTLFGGRRDGNTKDEMEKFFEYIEYTLDRSPKSISDLYRKAYIILDKKIPIMEMGSSIPNGKLLWEMKKLYFEGIGYLNLAKDIWHNLNLNSENELAIYKKKRKDVIKVYYRLGKAYNSLFETYCKRWNRINNETILYDEEEVLIDGNAVDDEYMEYLKLAIHSFKMAYKTLGGTKEILDTDIRDINSLFDSKSIEISDIIYQLGKTNLNLAIAQSRENVDIRKQYILKAKEYLDLSLNVKREKNYNLMEVSISEKKARCLILESKFEEAIQLLSNLRLNQTQSYVRNTLALAHTLNKSYCKVSDILSEDSQNKRNKTIFVTKITLALAYYKNGKVEEGKRILNSINLDYYQNTKLVNYYKG